MPDIVRGHRKVFAIAFAGLDDGGQQGAGVRPQLLEAIDQRVDPVGDLLPQISGESGWPEPLAW
jgi:hypothetical protein